MWRSVRGGGDTKTRKSRRTLALPTRCVQILKDPQAQQQQELGASWGLDPREWTPRELRHSFVSLLSDSGLPLEEISRLFGHSSTAVTELVYRKQIRPVVQSGALAMDRIFGSTDPSSDTTCHSLCHSEGRSPIW
ncbi:tyrosine-type recombinase/integrase [Nonomuraea sp. B19D2]|uniref:tyrosine-type recombinase/integrase n=1 Tax=Nonomuraea sp. B19D2 TaxID=3159561 RepID=UPI0032DB4F90